jgi:predicted N-acyltransferase
MAFKPLKQLTAKARKLHDNHRERHRPTGFGFAIADSIHYLDSTQWDRVTESDSVFLSRAYLHVLETAGPENSRQRYALIFRGKTAVAAVAAQSVRASAAQVPKSEMKKPVAGSLKRVQQNVLVCGNLLSWGPHGVAFAPGEDPTLLWPGVAEALYRIRRADRLLSSTDMVMIKDVPRDMMQPANALKRISYRSVETEPNMVLTLSPNWRSFEDYLAALTSSYRKTARKIFEEIRADGCVVETLADVTGFTEVIHSLYLQVHHRQRMRLVTLKPEFLHARCSLRSDFRCTVIRKEKEILGFVTTLRTAIPLSLLHRIR